MLACVCFSKGCIIHVAIIITLDNSVVFVLLKCYTNDYFAIDLYTLSQRNFACGATWITVLSFKMCGEVFFFCTQSLSPVVKNTSNGFNHIIEGFKLCFVMSRIIGILGYFGPRFWQRYTCFPAIMLSWTYKVFISCLQRHVAKVIRVFPVGVAKHSRAAQCMSWFKRFCLNLLVFIFCHLRRLSNKCELSHTSQKYAKNSCVIIITIKLTTIQIGQFITFSKDERMYCMPQNSIHFMCHCVSLKSFFWGFLNSLYTF